MAKEVKPLTIVVVEKETKEGHTFMTAKVRAKKLYEAGGKVTRESYDNDTNLDVKLTKSCGITLPAKEGIYEVDFAEAFEDSRADIKRPTCWIKPREGELNKVEFVFKCELPDPNKSESRKQTICILDEE